MKTVILAEVRGSEEVIKWEGYLPILPIGQHIAVPGVPVAYVYSSLVNCSSIGPCQVVKAR